MGELDDGTGISVGDEGPGIPDGKADRVFVDGYTTDEDGTGVGPTIVRQVVSAHGREISATESADGGARFEITGVDPVEE